MVSGPIRDPVNDVLLAPQNSALLVIDYQPITVASIGSMDHRTLVHNIVAVAKTAKLYGLPVVLSTVNVKNGINKPMIKPLQDVFSDIEPIDRTTLNAFEDVDFAKAVKATGRRKLIMTALWTEVCLAFPAVDALNQGYEVYPVVDAVGGTTVESHRAGIERIVQAGGRPISWTGLICELQRDWNRKDTAPEFASLLLSVEGLSEM